MVAGWEFFDKVYCISLAERTDRRAEAAAQFARVGLAERVEFVVVQKHPTDCEQGIYESHLLCMARGLAQGARQMLIFEDDILFDGFTPAALERGVAFLSAEPGWRMFFLGCMVKASRRTRFPGVVRIRYRSLTHAYAIHRSFAERLVERPWQGVPYDDFLRDLKDERSFALYPSFAFQSNSPSDNERYLPLDRVRRLLGGLRSLQKLDAFYHRNRWAIVGAHVLALLALVLAV
jgi:GR25 family glycosyltransferase involved in LPS biosynthesis